MSREILFRAYDEFRKEYLSGGNLFIAINKSNDPNKSEIYLDEISNADKYKERFVVEQHTGATDKKGKKIFEGDIVKFIISLGVVYIGKVVFNAKTAGFEIWRNITVGAYGEKATNTINFAHIDKIEVIGNIHDNPELLNEAE